MSILVPMLSSILPRDITKHGEAGDVISDLSNIGQPLSLRITTIFYPSYNPLKEAQY